MKLLPGWFTKTDPTSRTNNPTEPVKDKDTVKKIETSVQMNLRETQKTCRFAWICLIMGFLISILYFGGIALLILIYCERDENDKCIPNEPRGIGPMAGFG